VPCPWEMDGCGYSKGEKTGWTSRFRVMCLEIA